MLIFKRSAIIISRPTGNDHSDDDADCSGNQRYVQKVQFVSVLGNVEVQKYDADVEAARHEGYVSGANESIDNEKLRLQPMPIDDGGVKTSADDLPLLSYVRRSVWEL